MISAAPGAAYPAWTVHGRRQGASQGLASLARLADLLLRTPVNAFEVRRNGDRPYESCSQLFLLKIFLSTDLSMTFLSNAMDVVFFSFRDGTKIARCRVFRC